MGSILASTETTPTEAAAPPEPAGRTAAGAEAPRTVRRGLRIVLAKVGLDGHDRGIKVIARGLRDAGAQVIYAGIWQSPEAVAQAVVDEDADWLGISLLSGAHMALIPRVMEQLRMSHRENVGVVLGGIIPERDVQQLKQLGVAACFGPGTQIAGIVDLLNSKTHSSPFEAAAAVEGCRHQDRRLLSQLLTRISQGLDVETIRAALTQGGAPAGQPLPVTSVRSIAFTGSPGVGKSTLIARLLPELRASQRSVAVLSCDPQSPVTGGALLGDRIRMASSLPDSGIFIRSLATPSGSQGVAPNLDLMIQALTLFGFDVVLIETVGTGQGDILVRQYADTVVAVVQPESGDAVQWEKAGLLEIADVIVINKFELPGADRLAAELQAHLNFPGYRPVPLVPVSASDPSGLTRLLGLLRLPS